MYVFFTRICSLNMNRFPATYNLFTLNEESFKTKLHLYCSNWIIRVSPDWRQYGRNDIYCQSWFIYLFVYLFIHLFICLYMCLFNYLFIYLFIYYFIYPFIHLSTYIFIYLGVSHKSILSSVTVIWR